ncbi:MAG: glycerol-3-phosphate 1-O-acyltransferase PlsY [Casimicrobiaceae bacterium]
MAFPADLVAIVLAYLIGSLSFAVIVSRAMGLADPKSYGSGNPGATNVLRTGNRKAALLTLLGDAGKGVLAVALARAASPEWGLSGTGVAMVAVAVFLGHLYPAFFGFRGGKGVATAAGVLWVLDWRVGLGLTLIWLFVFALSRVSSLSALTASVVAPGVAFWLWGSTPAFWAVLAIALLLIWRHRSNVARLLSGQESAFKAQRNR